MAVTFYHPDAWGTNTKSKGKQFSFEVNIKFFMSSVNSGSYLPDT